MNKKILIALLSVILLCSGCSTSTKPKIDPKYCNHIDENPQDYICDICGTELPKPEPTTPGIEITNKDFLQELWTCSSGERVIQLHDDDYSNILAALEDGKITISSSDEDVIQVVGLYLKPISTGWSTIEVADGKTTDSVKLEVVEPSDKSPKFFLDYDGVSKYATYVGTEIELPKYSCFDSNNKDISEKVKVTSDLDENATYDAKTGKFKSDVDGQHNVVYSAEVDGHKTTRSIVVKVCKSIMSYERGGSNQKVKVADGLTDNPYVYVGCSQSQSGMEALAFNVNPSKVYYAEAMFKKPELSGISVGFCHSRLSTNKGFIREHLNVPNVAKAECNVTKAYNYGNTQHIINVYPAKIRTLIGTGAVNPGVYVSQEWTKIAISRINNDYYFFIDDYCYDHYTSKSFENEDTVPGIFCGSWKVGLNGTKARSFVLLDGQQAEEKVEDLKDTMHQYGYARNDASLSYCCGSYDAANKELLFETKENNQNYYNCIIMNNNLFQGSTHISFRYEAEKITGDDYSVFMVSALNRNFGDDPNSKLAQLFKGSIHHTGTYNTTFFFNAQQHETVYDSGDKRFQGDGSSYHYDVAIWDIDIRIIITGTEVSVVYSMTEYAQKSSDSTKIIAEADRKTYSITETSGFAMPSGNIYEQPWLAFCLEQHNPNASKNTSSYKISNLVIEGN